MAKGIQPAELGFFVQLATAGSLTAAARNLGVTVPAVSRKLALMERRVGMPLLNRTTRRMSLTPEGDVFLAHARRILQDIEHLNQLLTHPDGLPTGLLRVNTAFGFGRVHVAPAIARFVRAFPDIEVQLQLSGDPPPLADDAFDVCIRFGKPSDQRVVARKIASNHRLLCASPAYLADRGEPKVPADLARHQCITLRFGDDAYGLWRLLKRGSEASQTDMRKVRGALSTNDGETVVNWALGGLGIVMAADWLVGPYLRSGRLVPVLADYQTPEADIFAVYPRKHQNSLRVKLFIDHLEKSIAHLDDHSLATAQAP